MKKATNGFFIGKSMNEWLKEFDSNRKERKFGTKLSKDERLIIISCLQGRKSIYKKVIEEQSIISNRYLKNEVKRINNLFIKLGFDYVANSWVRNTPKDLMLLKIKRTPGIVLYLVPSPGFCSNMDKNLRSIITSVDSSGLIKGEFIDIERRLPWMCMDYELLKHFSLSPNN